MICVECRGRTCITCDIIWHPSETCADNAARRAEAQRAEEAAVTLYLTNNVKLCPRCNARGEKVSGCDHMTCKNLLLPSSHLPVLTFFIATRSSVSLPILLGLPCGL